MVLPWFHSTYAIDDGDRRIEANVTDPNVADDTPVAQKRPRHGERHC